MKKIFSISLLGLLLSFSVLAEPFHVAAYDVFTKASLGYTSAQGKRLGFYTANGGMRYFTRHELKVVSNQLQEKIKLSNDQVDIFNRTINEYNVSLEEITDQIYTIDGELNIELSTEDIKMIQKEARLQFSNKELRVLDTYIESLRNLELHF